MRVLTSALAGMMATATQVMAASGADAEPLSFMTILFVGFVAVILVFQIFPTVILFIGMVKGVLAPAVKKEDAATETGNE